LFIDKKNFDPFLHHLPKYDIYGNQILKKIIPGSKNNNILN